eukprot:TRINITY_DN26797_c0_g1_i2.p1 TRINITY_DN26797_c0_g1~~TRINITY_DN26797_c0_g1_i2.p1  ORF type:complete len:150 (-),score=22.72 TRINITY_DN26797_c0_g1_i2:74-523(-)
MIVEPAHPKEDDEANQRRFKAESWRESADASNGQQGLTRSLPGAWRPVLLTTFLGNYRHRHTEVVALDALIDLVLGAMAERQLPWSDEHWERLSGEVELVVPHTPCLSCVGALTQLRRWAPQLQIRVAYEDWRDWRSMLKQNVACQGFN